MSMKQESAISPVGTVEYMAPEVRGTADAAQDGWSESIELPGEGTAEAPQACAVGCPEDKHCSKPDSWRLPLLCSQVVALPPVDLVISGQIKATDIPPTNEKVDIWALGVTIYELVTGGRD